MRTRTRRTRKRRRKKTKSGNKFLGLGLLLGLAALSFADARHNTASYGLISGTVFRDPGFALPAAEVTLTPEPDSASSQKAKPMKAITDRRGEFIFRVPVTAMKYSVHAYARGYAPQDKAVSIEGEQHVEVTFLLLPESK